MARDFEFNAGIKTQSKTALERNTQGLALRMIGNIRPSLEQHYFHVVHRIGLLIAFNEGERITIISVFEISHACIGRCHSSSRVALDVRSHAPLACS